MSTNVDIAIRVDRNENSPQFTESEYRATVDETARYGVAIVNVIAYDDDRLTQNVRQL